MTGPAHTDAILAVGARPHPLPKSADFDQSPFDAASRGRTSKVKALNRFSAGRKCVEASDNVINDDFTTLPTTAYRTLVQCV